MIEVVERRVDDVVILDLTGSKRGASGMETQDKVVELLARGENKILLNYEGVEYIDSMGVGEIVSCYIKASTKNARLKLVNPGDYLLEILQHCQLDTLLECFFDEDAAISSF